MRVCPSCGYVEDPYWRQSRYCINLDYCFYNDFKIMKPDLAEKLNHQREVKDDLFIYRKGGTNRDVVERLDIEFHSWHGWRPKFEQGDNKYKGEKLTEFI